MVLWTALTIIKTIVSSIKTIVPSTKTIVWSIKILTQNSQREGCTELLMYNLANKSYAKKLSDAQVMLSGLKAHDEFAHRGSDAAFIGNLGTKINSSIELNNERERLKADLKTKTAQLDSEVSAMMALATEAQKGSVFATKTYFFEPNITFF